jgi:hypothetical protein
MKPLDFVKTPEGSFGIITEVSMREGDASVEWIYIVKPEKTAWWKPGTLEVISNLPNVLAQTMKHNMSSGSFQPF